MEIFLAVIGAITIVWLSFRWLKLIWFRTRVLSILKNNLKYDPAVPGIQSPAFNAITKHYRANDWNEYDAAIGFMLVQLGLISKPLSSESRAFYYEKLNLIESIANSSTVGWQLILEFKNGEFSA